MFRNEEVTTVNVIVKCDKCGVERKIGENIFSFDARMNECLRADFTFKNEDGVFKNYCRKCR
jgi:hypothetical protein